MKTILQFKKLFFAFTFFSVLSSSFGQCWNVIAGGNNHSLGLKSDGTLWAWGTNGDGQCGQGNFLGGTGAPTQVGNESNWTFIAAGNKCSYAIKNDGTLWAWGLNDFGQLGDGTLLKKNLPIQIGTDNDWQKISSGVDGHVLAIKTNGTLWAWGQNNHGQLGLGNSSVSVNVPTQVGNDSNWSSIATGFYYTIFLKINGTLWSCGLGNNGELGNGSNVLAFVPTQIGTQNNWIKIASGMEFSAAINNENKLFSWGKNTSGQLGIGNNINKNSPTLVNNDTNWDEIILGLTHSVAIKNNNSVWTWGNHFNCQLGNGNPCNIVGATINLPQQINSNTDWDKIFTGYSHSFSIKSNGDLWAWGFNGGNQLGNNSTSSSNVPIAITCPTTLNVALFEDTEFSFYPNPTNNVINITNQNEILNQINVYDMFGRLLKSQKGNNENEQINIQDLPNAIYILEINTEKAKHSVQVVKK
jgi:alpha-tubulin suppressor-like RCC1 family protein